MYKGEQETRAEDCRRGDMVRKGGGGVRNRPYTGYKGRRGVVGELPSMGGGCGGDGSSLAVMIQLLGEQSAGRPHTGPGSDFVKQAVGVRCSLGSKVSQQGVAGEHPEFCRAAH